MKTRANIGLIVGLALLSLAGGAPRATAAILFGSSTPTGFVDLYTIDSGTAAATPVGTDNRFETYIPEIEYGGGVIYATDTESRVLHTISPSTGQISSSFPLRFPAGGEVLTALEFVGATLYAGFTEEEAREREDTYLTAIDLATGDVSIIGATGIGSPLGGLAFDLASGVMFSITAGGSVAQLHTIDLVSGAATLVGPVTVDGAGLGATALEFGPDGVLYALPNRRDPLAGHLLRLDPATGEATDLGDTGIADLNALTSIPEPAVLPLLAIALGAAGLLRKRNRRGGQ